MIGFFDGLRTVLSLELRQRVRGKSWYILLGIFVALVAGVTLLLGLALPGLGQDAGGGIYSSIIFFILLLGTLITPALSGNAINGDRDSGTLATTQVTLISTAQLVLGKFLAAWISAVAFLVASLPFLVIAVALGGVRPDTILSSVLVLLLELGVIAAVGVGLSGLLARPLFSIVVTYLVVAALSIGTLILFTLGGLAVQSQVKYTYIGYEGDETGRVPSEVVCLAPDVSTYSMPRFDYFWGVLAANPYVVLADAAPTTFDRAGNATELFGYIKTGVRQAQLPPDLEPVTDECQRAEDGLLYADYEYDTAEEIVAKTVPGWFVGLGIHVVLGALALLAGWSATRTPARRLAKGSRIA